MGLGVGARFDVFYGCFKQSKGLLRIQPILIGVETISPAWPTIFRVGFLATHPVLEW
jgi:hypothetical protein